MRDKELDEIFGGASITPDKDAKEKAKIRMLTQSGIEKNKFLRRMIMSDNDNNIQPETSQPESQAKDPQEAPLNEAQKKPFFSFANRKFQFAAAALAICVVAVSALTLIPGMNLFGTTSAFCQHQHDESCGYAEAAPCNHQHDESCGEDGVDCTHEHDESCGYAEAAPCMHVHDEYCGGLVSEISDDDGLSDMEDAETDADGVDALDASGPGTPQILIKRFDIVVPAKRYYEIGELESQDNLKLPDTLRVTGYDLANASGGFKPLTIRGVTWYCDKPEEGFDPAVPGEYRFRPELPEGYSLEEGVSLAFITVTINPEVDKNDTQIRLKDVKQSILDLNKSNGGKSKDWYDVVFNKKESSYGLKGLEEGDIIPSQHIQGYVRYGDSEEWHIFSRSTTSDEGYLYFIYDDWAIERETESRITSDTISDLMFLKVPNTSHPGGMQRIGDYLIVGASGKFYIYDLAPLKDGNLPSLTNIASDLSPGATGASGICDVNLGLTADNSTETETATSKRKYVVAGYNKDNGLNLFISQPVTKLEDAKFEAVSTSVFNKKVGYSYNNIHLVCDKAGDLYMIGLRSTPESSPMYDFVELWKLTKDGGTKWLSAASSIGKYEFSTTVYKSIAGVDALGIHFRFGGSVFIWNDDSLSVFVCSRLFDSAKSKDGISYSYVRANEFEPTYYYKTDEPVPD